MTMEAICAFGSVWIILGIPWLLLGQLLGKRWGRMEERGDWLEAVNGCFGDYDALGEHALATTKTPSKRVRWKRPLAQEIDR